MFLLSVYCVLYLCRVIIRWEWCYYVFSVLDLPVVMIILNWLTFGLVSTYRWLGVNFQCLLLWQLLYEVETRKLRLAAALLISQHIGWAVYLCLNRSLTSYNKQTVSVLPVGVTAIRAGAECCFLMFCNAPSLLMATTIHIAVCLSCCMSQ